MLHIISSCEVDTIKRHTDLFQPEDYVVHILGTLTKSSTEQLAEYLSATVNHLYYISDVEQAELTQSLPAHITRISYEEFVKLCETNSSIQTWY